MDADTEAISSDGFVAREYVEAYCCGKYGLSEDESKKFWHHLCASSNLPIGDSSTKGHLAIAHGRTLAFRDFLTKVSPKALQEHFEHYRLMTDIRLSYINVQLARLEAESSTAGLDVIDQIEQRLQELREVANELNDRFAELHHENLYPGAIEAENQARNQELELLYKRIAKQR